jgi:competence ComEA-like helix-hairpin-helix protein
MRLSAWLQERFGFTHSEIVVILFLSLTFCAGNAVKLYRETWGSSPTVPQFDYSDADSEFVARSRSLLASPPLSSRPSTGAKPRLPSMGIDLNSASVDQLMLLPGIGRSTAEKIVAYRSEHGPFSDPRKLMNVKGIGSKKFEKIKPFIRTDER